MAKFIPYEHDAFWMRYGYTSVLNIFSLIICMFGAKAFGRTTVLILYVALVIILLTFASFVLNSSVQITFSSTTTELEHCNPPNNDKYG